VILTPHVPPDVIANVQQRWPDRADRWASHVEAELRELCTRYDAESLKVLPARYGFVIAAETPSGPVVLRSSPDPHGSEQAAVAATLARLGIAPTVHGTVSTDHGTWTVMERVKPGTPLAAADPATITLNTLFSPLRAMNGQPAPVPGMPSITDWLRDRLRDDHLSDLRPGTTIATADERRAALAILEDLAHDLTPGLCHSDVSTRNILSSGQARWKFIDPRGMTGETAYDVAVLGIRVARLLPSQDLAATVCRVAGVDAERVHAWMTLADAARV
jgi:streptomycin 6-kinase